MTGISFEEFLADLRPRFSGDIPDGTRPECTLVDLGVDSFQALELVILAEIAADCLVPPDSVPELRTLADAFRYYELCVADATAQA